MLYCTLGSRVITPATAGGKSFIVRTITRCAKRLGGVTGLAAREVICQLSAKKRDQTRVSRRKPPSTIAQPRSYARNYPTRRLARRFRTDFLGACARAGSLRFLPRFLAARALARSALTNSAPTRLGIPNVLRPALAASMARRCASETLATSVLLLGWWIVALGWAGVGVHSAPALLARALGLIKVG